MFDCGPRRWTTELVRQAWRSVNSSGLGYGSGWSAVEERGAHLRTSSKASARPRCRLVPGLKPVAHSSKRKPSYKRGCVEDQPQQLEQTWCWNSPSSLCVSHAAAGLSDTAAFRGKSPPRAVSRCARSNEGGVLKMETFKPSGYN